MTDLQASSTTARHAIGVLVVAELRLYRAALADVLRVEAGPRTTFGERS